MARGLPAVGSRIRWRRLVVRPSLVGNGMAVLLIGVAWFGASGEAPSHRQLGWMGLAAAGLVLSWMTNLAVLRTARRLVARRAATLTTDDPAPPAATTVPAPPLVAGPFMTRYHRPDCLLAAGKDVEAADAETHRAAGRRPCGMCGS